MVGCAELISVKMPGKLLSFVPSPTLLTGKKKKKRLRCFGQFSSPSSDDGIIAVTASGVAFCLAPIVLIISFLPPIRSVSRQLTPSNV